MKFRFALAIVGASVFSSSLFAQSYVVSELSPTGTVQCISGGLIGGMSAGGHAYLWSVAGSTDLHSTAYTNSMVTGRSGSLSVGYGTVSSLVQVPLAWVGTTMTEWPMPEDIINCRFLATDGTQIVGNGYEGDPETGLGAVHAFVWNFDSGEVTDLGKKRMVYGVGGGTQVGVKLGSKGSTAMLWHGTDNSATDIHPKDYDISVATDTDGQLHVGYAGIDIRVRNEARPRKIRFYTASYWTNAANSFTPLFSPYRHSYALGIEGDTIVGYGNLTDVIGNPKESRAVAWVGPNHDYVDLHALLPSNMRTSAAKGVDAQGNIVGFGYTTAGQLKTFVWMRQ